MFERLPKRRRRGAREQSPRNERDGNFLSAPRSLGRRLGMERSETGGGFGEQWREGNRGGQSARKRWIGCGENGGELCKPVRAFSRGPGDGEIHEPRGLQLVFAGAVESPPESLAIALTMGRGTEFAIAKNPNRSDLFTAV